MESLSEDELRTEILAGLPRMHAAHREHLASYFKGDGTQTDLRALIETSPLLRERFAAFLSDTPEALEAFVPAPRKRSRVLPYVIAACAALLAIIPLLAQYQQQRTLVSGPTTVDIAPAPLIAATLRPAPAHRIALHRPPPSARTHRKPHPQEQQRRRAPRAVASIVRIATPVSQHHPRARRRRIARVGDPVVSRARSVVDKYLNDVIHGNIFDAPEASIVGPMAATRVVSVRPSNDRLKVDVTINGPRGKYYEVFYVARGPMRIVDRFYAPER